MDCMPKQDWMKGKTVQAAIALIAIAVCVCAALHAQQPAKTAEQAYKNIQALKSVPADQVIPSMQFISASLGVECEYCHVAGAFEKDDKKPKQTARKMMEMMLAINKTNFEDHREVTCYSCHHGDAKPQPIPAIPENVSMTHEPGQPADATKKDEDTNSQAAAEQILNKYVAASGGANAIRKVTSRVEKGAADVGGKQMSIDIYAQGPDKRVSVMHLPNGESVTAFNGAVGWLSVPGRPTHWMSAGEAEAARLDADLYFPARLKDIFKEFTLAASETVDGHELNVVQALRDGKPPVKLYFDQQSGLLIRMVRYADTPLGWNPSQIDYADYRDLDGVKIPYRWTIARPSGRFTIQVQQVQQNIPIEVSRFVPPAETPAPDHK